MGWEKIGVLVACVPEKMWKTRNVCLKTWSFFFFFFFFLIKDFINTSFFAFLYPQQYHNTQIKIFHGMWRQFCVIPCPHPHFSQGLHWYTPPKQLFHLKENTKWHLFSSPQPPPHPHLSLNSAGYVENPVSNSLKTLLPSYHLFPPRMFEVR